MDPLSVIEGVQAAGASIGACLNLTCAIIQFIKEVGEVDNAIAELEKEIVHLELILKAVQDGFDQVQNRRKSETAPSNTVLDAVNLSLAGCNDCLKALYNAILRVSAANNGIARKSIAVLKIRSEQLDLEKCRAKLNGYKQDLSLSLILVACSLCTDVSAGVTQSRQPQDDPFLHLENEMRFALDSTTMAYYDEAVDNRGRSVLRETAEEFLEHSKYSKNSRASVSMLLNENGSTEQDEYVIGWVDRIRQIQENQENHMTTPVSSPSTTSDDGPIEVDDLDSRDTNTRRRISSPDTIATNQDPRPTKHNIKLTMSRRFIQRGSVQYEQRDWQQAAKSLQSALTHVSELDVQDRSKLDLDPVYFKLGLLFLRDEKIDDAEDCFSRIVQLKNGSDPRLVLDAKLNWGKICLKKNNLNKALILAEDATNEFADMLGERSPEYFAASLLLAHVYLQQGLQDAAEILVEDHPQEQKDQIISPSSSSYPSGDSIILGDSCVQVTSERRRTSSNVSPKTFENTSFPEPPPAGSSYSSANSDIDLRSSPPPVEYVSPLTPRNRTSHAGNILPQLDPSVSFPKPGPPISGTVQGRLQTGNSMGIPLDSNRAEAFKKSTHPQASAHTPKVDGAHIMIVSGMEFSKLEKVIFGRRVTFSSKSGGPKVCSGAVRLHELKSDDAYGPRTRPRGTQSFEKYYQCKHCHFEPKATIKKNAKGDEVLDGLDRVVYNLNGIPYRWEFLFKSHIKQRDYLPYPMEDHAQFACLFCYAEGSGRGSFLDPVSQSLGSGTPVFKGKARFLNHLNAHCQIQPKSEAVRYMNAIVGRCPAFTEDFAVALPSPCV